MNAPTEWLGPTPWEDIAAAFDEQYPEGFEMELTGDDSEIAQMAVNQGIDSRLEAVSFVEGKPPGWISKKDSKGRTISMKLHLVFDRWGLLIFLRRLYEYYDGESVDEHDQARGDRAHSLRAAILTTLDIEEI